MMECLVFTGVDAVRFLNGQVTQDVRGVVGTGRVLPSCVTDVKGKLQFRVWLAGGKEDGAVLVFCREGEAADLKARLTRYLIADEVEVRDVSGEVSADDFEFPNAGIDEETRIREGIPKWGAELNPGMLPPEAGLGRTDISYAKGCYIGQEVISRIKSAGKVNRRLVKFAFDGEGKIGEIVNREGKSCGVVTSAHGKAGLGFLKRKAEGETELEVEGEPVRVGEYLAP